MGLRPNNCYRDIERAYTRHATRVQKKDFLGGVPGLRTRQFVMGNQTKDFKWVLDYKATSPMQVRDNALEALRLKMVRELNNNVGKDNWTMKIRLWPHHILRENKMASGAGADRVSDGMKHAFGKNTGRAAQIKKNAILFSIVVNDEHLAIAEKIIRKAKFKVNLPHEIIVSEHKNQRLSGRKKWTREAKIAKTKSPAEISADEAEKTKDIADKPAKTGKKK